MMIAGVDTKPALTAVSPNTSAPTTDSAMPTYFGIRMLASFRISRTINTRSISREGERGRSRILPEIVSNSLMGMSCNLKSCAAT